MITMIKDIMNANDSATPNSREMAVLKENFPSCFRADGSFDIERFKEFLSDKIAVTGEGYELKFLGKNYAPLAAESLSLVWEPTSIKMARGLKSWL
jgi:adenine-specific DNA-methyltransferase